MTNFPVRKLSTPGKIIAFPGDFVIRPLEPLISGKDMIQESHRHDFYFILALGKASGEHMIDFEPYKVCNCSVFFLRPGQVHQLTLRTGSKGYLMQFTADFFNPESREANQLLRRAAKKNACYPDADGYKRLDALLHSIYQEFTGKQDGYQEIIKASLIIFFVELIRQKQESADTSTGVTTYQKARLEEFLELLETHVATHKKASQYAHMMNLSLHQLNSITRAAVGKTTSDLIREYLVLEARRYLLGTADQVKEIAYGLGFEDASYFIRFFRKQTGYSPKAFRDHFR